LIFCAGGFESTALPIEKDDYILAADGGLVHLQKLGVAPHGIIGDFDSLGYVPQNAQVFPVEKDDTDSMLAVRKGLELGYREFILYGALDGPRLDHTIANLQTLLFLENHGAKGTLVGLNYLITTVKDRVLRLPKADSGIVSVFCLGEPAQGVTIRGLKYELENGILESGFPLGVSNHFVGKEATVSVESGTLILMYDVEKGFPQGETK
jgi:thiamine pyrophosphokinase